MFLLEFYDHYLDKPPVIVGLFKSLKKTKTFVEKLTTIQIQKYIRVLPDTIWLLGEWDERTDDLNRKYYFNSFVHEYTTVLHSKQKSFIYVKILELKII